MYCTHSVIIYRLYLPDPKHDLIRGSIISIDINIVDFMKMGPILIISRYFVQVVLFVIFDLCHDTTHHNGILAVLSRFRPTHMSLSRSK